MIRFRVPFRLALCLMSLAVPCMSAAGGVKQGPPLAAPATGLVTITISEGARVYLGAQWVGEVSPNRPWTIPLRAGKKHRLRFLNRSHGIDFTREFIVEKNTEIRVRYTVRHKWIRS